MIKCKRFQEQSVSLEVHKRSFPGKNLLWSALVWALLTETCCGLVGLPFIYHISFNVLILLIIYLFICRSTSLMGRYIEFWVNKPLGILFAVFCMYYILKVWNWNLCDAQLHFHIIIPLCQTAFLKDNTGLHASQNVSVSFSTSLSTLIILDNFLTESDVS